MPQFNFIYQPDKEADKERIIFLKELKESATWRFLKEEIIAVEMEARLEVVLEGGDNADLARETYKFLKFFAEFPERELARLQNAGS
jgi:hypothetical protein